MSANYISLSPGLYPVGHGEREMDKTTDTHTVAQRGVSPQSAPRRQSSGNERFPSFDDPQPNVALLPVIESPHELSPHELGSNVLGPPAARWTAKRQSVDQAQRRQNMPGHRHRRSVSQAIHRLRTRTGSISENAQELAEALKAPISWRLIILCVIWYNTSALTNTSSKSILNAFPMPVTLTLLQFASVSIWCLLFAWLASLFPSMKQAIPALKNGLRYPSLEVISTALPLSIFQLLGHLLSSYATSKVPVSLVHTIKGLSPLFTVLAYRLFFRIRYARATYLSLVPLTAGVMMACSTDFSTNLGGIIASLIAAIVCVTQNIFSKKLFTESSLAEAEGQTAKSKRLDKLNLLCYSSVGAFLFTAPVWIFTEGLPIIGDFLHDGALDLTEKKDALDHRALAVEFLFNGVFHFAQNIIAFVLLSLMSPVSYSVASLIKRVWVILVAILWFRSHTTNIQALGVGLTFLGLYLYDRTSTEDAAERRTKTDHFRHKNALLPLIEVPDSKQHNGHVDGPRRALAAFSFPDRKEDPGGSHPSTGDPTSIWLPPGTKQETTWEAGHRGASQR